MKDNPVQRKSFDFALRIVALYRQLVEQHEYVLSRQLLRSGTSIGANVEEALAGQSRADFQSKMAVASKEARETRYWLRLLQQSGITGLDLQPALQEVEELNRIITSIVKTTAEHR